MVGKHGIGDLRCDQCDFVTPWKFKLEQHKTEHGEYPCTKCSYVGREDVNQNVLLISDQLVLSCPVTRSGSFEVDNLIFAYSLYVLRLCESAQFFFISRRKECHNGLDLPPNMIPRHPPPPHFNPNQSLAIQGPRWSLAKLNPVVQGPISTEIRCPRYYPVGLW